MCVCDCDSWAPVRRIPLNCELFVLTLLFALPLGLVVAFGSMSRCSRCAGLVKTFVWIIRGTPLMLQIIVIYLGPGLLG